MYKIEFVQIWKVLRQKIYDMTPKYAEEIKIKSKKFLKVGFIRPVDNTQWMPQIILDLKNNEN